MWITNNTHCKTTITGTLLEKTLIYQIGGFASYL